MTTFSFLVEIIGFVAGYIAGSMGRNNPGGPNHA